MDYETLTEDDVERYSFEVVQVLPANQFEAALADETILLDETSLRGLLTTLEADHVRASVRSKVGHPFPAPPGTPPASNAGLVEDLERRITALKERLGIVAK